MRERSHLNTPPTLSAKGSHWTKPSWLRTLSWTAPYYYATFRKNFTVLNTSKQIRPTASLRCEMLGDEDPGLFTRSQIGNFPKKF